MSNFVRKYMDQRFDYFCWLDVCSAKTIYLSFFICTIFIYI